MAVCGHYTEPRVPGQGKSSVLTIRSGANENYRRVHAPDAGKARRVG